MTSFPIFRIRPAHPADIGEAGDGGIRDLYNKTRRHARANGQSPLSPPSYAQWERNMERHAQGEPTVQLLVAETSKGEIIGFATATHHPNGVSKLGKLLVDPDAQGHGIGQKLVAQISHAAKRHGNRILQVCAEHGQDHASGFYQNLGFEITGNRRTEGGMKIDELELDLTRVLSLGQNR